MPRDCATPAETRAWHVIVYTGRLSGICGVGSVLNVSLYYRYDISGGAGSKRIRAALFSIVRVWSPRSAYR